jgi:capsular polysaccharide transport system permease protein
MAPGMTEQANNRSDDRKAGSVAPRAQATAQPQKPAGAKPAPAAQPQKPAGAKPAPAAQPQKPAGEKPAPAAEPQKPAGAKPAPAAQPQKPAGAKPAPAAQPQKPAGAKPAPAAQPQKPAGAKPAPAAQPQKPAQAANATVAEDALAVRPAHIRRRHRMILASFGLVVLLPTLLATAYLYLIAADQYSSHVSFTVRSEEFQNPFALLNGAIGATGTASSSETDILYDFILSQKLVQNIERRLDLEAIYSRPAFDPVFALRRGLPIEDMADYWRRMVAISYDRTGGLIRVETFAFTPEDAHDIATAIVEESDSLVNALSQIARDDATRSAEEDLRRAVERLRTERVELSAFRTEQQIIDPEIEGQIPMGVLTALQQQLAEALIGRAMLAETTREGDPRLEQADRRVDALRAQIAEERDRLATATARGGESLVSVIGNYESLLVDLEFAQQAYVSAAAAYDTALAEARRRSVYLATHIPPTTAESPQYPRRLLLAAATFAGLTLLWLVGLLSYYAARDR